MRTTTITTLRLRCSPAVSSSSSSSLPFLLPPNSRSHSHLPSFLPPLPLRYPASAPPAFSTLPRKAFMHHHHQQKDSSNNCLPCTSNHIHAMSKQSALDLLQQVKDWELITDNDVFKLQRSWKVQSFTKGLDFFQLVANVAEAQGHHPDLHLVGWNNVKIEIWTHSVGGLTENDFILASKIDSLDTKHLLRKKKTASS